jgi:phosphoglycolate phosphatase-like HAD superfamily hydrolase
MHSIKTLIFDLDGTLLDTLGDITDSVNYTLKQLNLDLI